MYYSRNSFYRPARPQPSYRRRKTVSFQKASPPRRKQQDSSRAKYLRRTISDYKPKKKNTQTKQKSAKPKSTKPFRSNARVNHQQAMLRMQALGNKLGEHIIRQGSQVALEAALKTVKGTIK